MVKCVDCGKELNPIEALLSEKSNRCGNCIRKLHKQITRG